MNGTFITFFLISAVSYGVWKCLRFFIPSSPWNIPGPSGGTYLKGHFGKLFGRNAWSFHEEIAHKYGAVSRIRGLFGAQQLYVFDPTALHHIVVKDQYVYEETPMFLEFNKLIFGTSLLSTLGEHHRRQRKLLNPVFSSKHMRDLTPIFYSIAKQLREILMRKVRAGEEEMDMCRWMSRAAIEYIGQGGMGYTFNSLEGGAKNRYLDAANGFSPLFAGTFFIRPVLPFLVKLGPPTFRRKIIDMMPIESLHKWKETVDTLYDESVAIFKSKKSALLEGEEVVARQVGKGKDILSVLLKANMASAEGDRLPEEEIYGQINTFIFAGHDTTTLALSRILHQLCLHHDVQDKLREEVTAARAEHGDLDYDTLMALPLLDAVCRETLRCFPPVAGLNRIVREDVVLPLMYPIKSADGRSEIREIPLKKGTSLMISIYNANRSKAIWGEDAQEWKPERWLGKSPDEVAKVRLPGVYSSMMTFLGGGRACIGFKFSELEMKVVLSVLLESFRFSLGSKEIEWVLRGLASPTTKGSAAFQRELPLKLTLV